MLHRYLLIFMPLMFITLTSLILAFHASTPTLLACPLSVSHDVPSSIYSVGTARNRELNRESIAKYFLDHTLTFILSISMMFCWWAIWVLLNVLDDEHLIPLFIEEFGITEEEAKNALAYSKCAVGYLGCIAAFLLQFLGTNQTETFCRHLWRLNNKCHYYLTQKSYFL